jgi:hypothetical protein
MGYDNADRFRYTVMQDCVLPKQDGGMQRLKRGEEVTGPHYERFTKTGVLMRVEGPGTKAAALTTAPKTPPTVEEDSPTTEPEGEPQGEPEGDDDGEEEEEELTREDLESMTKAQIMEAYAPEWSGTKADLIDHLLGEGE